GPVVSSLSIVEKTPQSLRGRSSFNPTTDAVPAQFATSFGWLDAALIASLLLFSLGIHSWLIGHTEVTARDSVGFIRYAWQLEHQPWGELLRQNHQHPGYPILLLATSYPVRRLARGTDAELFQLSAQLASALAGMLLVIPMYFLGKLLVNRSTGF